MALPNYTLTQVQDKYYIKNEETITIEYTLKDIDPCTADEIIETGNILAGETLLVPIIKDGLFKVDLALLVTPTEITSVYIQYYLNLQLSMIEDIFTVLCPCDCGCANCVDLSVDGCQALLTTRTKIDVFKYLVYPTYSIAFNTVHSETSCLIEPQLYCDIVTEGVTGMASYNEELTKQLIALDYLAMYFSDLLDVTDQDEIDYINNKYQSESILCCINKLGINIKEIEEIITDNMATITINTGVYENLPPDAVGDNTIATANRTNYVFTLDDFTTDTTPPYNDPEGNPPLEVRINTLPVAGTLELNAITVVPGQVIPVIDITNSLLVFIPPSQDAVDASNFEFSVSDSGSGLFTPA